MNKPEKEHPPMQNTNVPTWNSSEVSLLIHILHHFKREFGPPGEAPDLHKALMINQLFLLLSETLNIFKITREHDRHTSTIM